MYTVTQTWEGALAGIAGILWVLLSSLLGIVAYRKGRSVLGWCLLWSLLITSLSAGAIFEGGPSGILGAFLGFFLPPIIGLVLVSVLPARTKKLEARALRKGMKKCPECAELVRSDAMICRFCRFDFRSGPGVENVLPGVGSRPGAPQRYTGAVSNETRWRRAGVGVVLLFFIGGGFLLLDKLGFINGTRQPAQKQARPAGSQESPAPASGPLGKGWEIRAGNVISSGFPEIEPSLHNGIVRVLISLRCDPVKILAHDQEFLGQINKQVEGCEVVIRDPGGKWCHYECDAPAGNKFRFFPFQVSNRSAYIVRLPSGFCGSGGCRDLLFLEGVGGWELVADVWGIIELVGAPISDAPDILLNGEVRLKWDGTQYNPHREKP